MPSGGGAGGFGLLRHREAVWRLAKRDGAAAETARGR